MANVNVAVLKDAKPCSLVVPRRPGSATWRPLLHHGSPDFVVGVASEIRPALRPLACWILRTDFGREALQFYSCLDDIHKGPLFLF